MDTLEQISFLKDILLEPDAAGGGEKNGPEE